MPSSWLSAGAGASQGLEELLTRQRQDEIVRNNMAQHQGTLAETVRSHQAEEGLRQQQMQGAEADRGLARQSLDMQREAQRQKMQSDEENQLRERLLQREDRRVPGSPVDFPEYQQVRQLGVLPMSSYQVSNGDPLPNGDSGPPLPKIAFTGTQPQLMAQQGHADTVANQQAMREQAAMSHEDTVTNQQAIREQAATSHADAVAAQKATLAATEAQRGTTNEIARGNLSVRQQQLADAEARRKESQGEVKVGEKGKADLTSLQNAQDISARLLANIRAQHPDIEDPNAVPDMMGNKINQKYNTVGNKIGNLVDIAKYWGGIYNDQSSPMIQLESLLTPVQAGRYMGGSRNQKMLDLVVKHMANPGQTLGEQYSRLKTLQDLTPAMRQAIVDAARPVKVDASGKMIERGGGGGNSSGNGLPPGVTVTRID